MAAITVMLALMNLYLPLAGTVLMFVLPVPIVLMQLRYGMRFAVLTTVVSGALLTALAGPLEGLALFSSFSLLGLTYGFALRRDFSPSWAVLAGTVAATVTLGISLLMGFFIMGISPVDLANQSYEAMNQALLMYERWNLVTPEVKEQFLAVWELFRTRAHYILPATFLLGSTFSSFITYQFLRPILGRLGHRVEPLPPFITWQAPQGMVMLPVASVAMSMSASWHSSDAVMAVASNLYLFSTILFTVQGMSVAGFYADRYGLPKLLRMLVYPLILLNPLFQQVGLVAGMLDSLLDYRKLRESRPVRP